MLLMIILILSIWWYITYSSYMKDLKSKAVYEQVTKPWYNNYSADLLRNDKINILNFSASWCPNCKKLNENLLNSEIPENINILKVDFDNSQKLKEKYWVTKQTTLVQVDWDWNEIKKWSLSSTLEDILSQIDNTVLLPKNTTVKNTTVDNNFVENNTDNQVITWKYIEYSEEELKNSKWNIVLFFNATWCPSCQTSDKNFNSDKVPDNLSLLKVDYDKYTDLKQKYWITMQHTFVQVDWDWNEIKKWSLSSTLEDIISQIK